MTSLGLELLRTRPDVATTLLYRAIKKAKKANLDRRYREKNRQAISQASKRRYALAPETVKTRASRHYAENKNHKLARLHERYHTDPIVKEKKKKAAKEWQTINRARYREYVTRWRHRVLGFPAPTRVRPDLCECCGQKPGKHSLHLDHCHATGIFRGWLCGKCNRAIGALGDTEVGLQKALAYLRRAAAAP